MSFHFKNIEFLYPWRDFAEAHFTILPSLRSSTFSPIHVVVARFVTTLLLGETEIPVRIPNKEINNQRLSNISRVPACQIKQTLRLQYSDASKIPAFLDALKEEIRRTCPELISDGSRPFRAQLRNFEADHLAVVIDFHFANVRPGGDAYYELVQRVMQTVDEVMNSRGLTYALPTSVIREEGKGI